MANPQDLEKNVHRLLRSLPDRPAPSGLEPRVLAEIARRAKQPWWRRSYASWPAAVRGVFFVVSAVAAAGLVLALLHLQAHQPAATGAVARAWSRWSTMGGGIVTALRGLGSFIPAPWVYGGLAVIVACYAALGAVGALAAQVLRRAASSSSASS